MQAGFDGYYGSFFNLKDWNAQEFIEHILFNQKLLSSFKEPKSVILSFTTHDEVSPILLHGENFSIMISWLEATLPFNPYCIDGFFSVTEGQIFFPRKTGFSDPDAVLFDVAEILFIIADLA